MSEVASDEKRLRRIATLISIVDTTAAKQLVSHLPAAIANQVIQLAATIGPVPPEEKRRLLAEFQQSAASPQTAAAPVASSASPSAPTSSLVAPQPFHSQLPSSATPQPVHSSTQTATTRSDFVQGETVTPFDETTTPWAQLGKDALVRFARRERPAVIAVIISQLPASLSVDVLGELGASMSSEVIRRLSRLQEIDPAAKAAIDEHLEEQLGQQQQAHESESVNVRMVEALLSQAPGDLQANWVDALSGAPESFTAMTSRFRTTPPATPVTAPLQSSVNTDDNTQFAPTERSHIHHADQQDITPPSPGSLDIESDDEVPILPFALPTQSSEADDESNRSVDRSLLQMEFDRVLDIAPENLAQLLSQLDSQTVLLALAGASPQFMNRFCSMLDRRDARILRRRLLEIGSVQLRDMDEAQQRIVDAASQFLDHAATPYRYAA